MEHWVSTPPPPPPFRVCNFVFDLILLILTAQQHMYLSLCSTCSVCPICFTLYSGLTLTQAHVLYVILIWLKYCRYGLKHFRINQAICLFLSDILSHSTFFFTLIETSPLHVPVKGCNLTYAHGTEH